MLKNYENLNFQETLKLLEKINALKEAAKKGNSEENTQKLKELYERFSGTNVLINDALYYLIS